MNKNIKLAVAGAVLAMSATAANAGIVIPAGEWTLDINGNVNAYVNYSHTRDSNTIDGGIALKKTAGDQNGDKVLGINTGLLPAWLGFTATTRQNDLDVSWNMSLQPNVSDNAVSGDAKAPLFRTANFTFGDKSWGTIKLGKDIGIFASDAILNDMTLLGVGAPTSGLSGASTTLGGIGSGYLYAGWKGQATYITPNFNGFQATVGITNPNQVGNSNVTSRNQDRYGLEAKASYTFDAGAAQGKIWVSGLSYQVATANTTNYSASAGDIGVNLNANGFGLTGYYYSGKGIGTTMFGNGAVVGSTPGLTSGNGSNSSARDSDGGYIQLTYVLPTKTKLGVAYGESNLDLGTGEVEATSTVVKSNERWTVGAYHPLTKHLNLVAEYNNIQSTSHAAQTNESQTYSVGGILFF